MTPLGDFSMNPPFMPCRYPWEHLVVQWDGTVVPCCRDYNAENALGSVRRSSLREIWNGPGCEKLRRQHAAGEFVDNEICRRCTSLYYTTGSGAS